MQPPVDPLIGVQVSEYIIQERIGTGGMGIVYRAVQPLIGKQVAIKVLRAQFAGSPEVMERLLVEARVVNAIQHRGIIDIFGFGTLADGRPYMVMELLQGTSLDAFIRKHRPVSAAETAGILDEMLAVLGAAHRSGVIHRDLKPSNVFLTEGADGSRTLKLLDFGIAKMAEYRGSRPLTVEGTVLGTPAYMAPEQARGEKLTASADLYAVGVIAFQMLTGRPPFRGDPSRVLMDQLEVPPPAPSSLVAQVPARLEAIVLRLLAKSPSERFPSAEAVRQELKAFMSGPSREVTVSKGPRTIEVPMLAAVQQAVPAQAPVAVASFPRRARSLLSLGVAALVLLPATDVPGGQIKRPVPVVEAPGASGWRPVNVVAEDLEPPMLISAESPARRNRPSRPTKLAALTELAGTKAELPHPLRARLKGIDAQLSRLDPKVCSVTAMAELKAIQREAELAATEAQRTHVATRLDGWERTFLLKR